MEPKVSIVVTTYNHERFIAKALDSILEQNISFPVEVLVGEDDSQDSTREIVEEYASTHRGRISLVLQDRKNVIRIDGVETGRFNFMDLIGRASGEFIAFCEGDDYWTDRGKLQMQVDYLTANQEVSMCFHDAFMITDTGDRKSFPDLGEERRFNTRDLFTQWFIPTSSMLFRNKVVFPPWFTDVISGDIPLHFLLSEQGELAYLPRCMSAYRKHPGGISNQHTGYYKAIGMSRLYHYLDAHFDHQYRDLVNQAIEYEFNHHVIRPALHSGHGERLGALRKKLGLSTDSLMYRSLVWMRAIKRKMVR